jgi:transposase
MHEMAKRRRNEPSTETSTETETGSAEPSRPQRRSFTPEFKMRILREADEAVASGEPGALGALLRKEGVYSSNLATWRKERDAGVLAALTPKKRGRKATVNPLAADVERLQREVDRLQKKLSTAEVVIDVQKKLSLLLGITLPTPTEEELKKGRKP